MKEYQEKIIIPYVNRKRKELKVSADQPALAIFDVFKGQQTKDIAKLLEENNIYISEGSIPHIHGVWPSFLTIELVCSIYSIQLHLWGGV